MLGHMLRHSQTASVPRTSLNALFLITTPSTTQLSYILKYWAQAEKTDKALMFPQCCSCASLITSGTKDSAAAALMQELSFRFHGLPSLLQQIHGSETPYTLHHIVSLILQASRVSWLGDRSYWPKVKPQTLSRNGPDTGLGTPNCTVYAMTSMSCE